MPIDLPTQTIVAVATVVGALIAGLFSFVNLTLTKEQKTSEFRQAWIDGLREDLSVFLASARAFARAYEAKLSPPEPPSVVLYPISDEGVATMRHEIAESFYRIKLRLNSKETEHIELLRLLEAALARQNEMSVKVVNATEVLAAIERAADYARPLLKTEWDRVKKGELPFRVVRNWLAPLLVILCLAFIWFLLNGKFRV